MLLSELKEGQKAKVLTLLNPEKLKKRLENIGLTRGATITLLKKAPLGDPIEIGVRDFYMALRKSDAELIYVELL
jgi:Fe2+ transport system protein FeoA